MPSLLVFAGLLSLGLSGPVLGSELFPSESEPRCQEEREQAAQWIRWASERRAACLTGSANSEIRASCLQRAQQDLSRLEKEHTKVYESQIRTLPPEHPVVSDLILKLKNNIRAAEVAIISNTDAREIAAFRNQLCAQRR